MALNRAAALSPSGTARRRGWPRSTRWSAGALAGYHYLPAARADLLRRLRPGEAAAAYRVALALADNEVERSFLQGRLDALPHLPPPCGGRFRPRQRPDTRRSPGLGSPA